MSLTGTYLSSFLVFTSVVFFLPPSNPPPIRLLRDPCFTPFDQGRLIIVSLRNRCADTVETFVFERFAYSEFRETITFVER